MPHGPQTSNIILTIVLNCVSDTSQVNDINNCSSSINANDIYGDVRSVKKRLILYRFPQGHIRSVQTSDSDLPSGMHFTWGWCIEKSRQI